MSDFDFSSYKVLLCDTDPEVIDTARTAYLDAEIGDFVATPSPKEAIKHIPVMKPDLILVALKFPDISGVQVIQKIRSLNEGEFYKTPILMLLDKVSQNLLREACRAGIEGALRKPLRPEKILRFTRAVILKPRRFVCIRHYFGPERRVRDDPHLKNDNRRKNSENSTDEFTSPQRTQRARAVEPGKSALDSSPLHATPSPAGSENNAEQAADWAPSQTRNSSTDGQTNDYASLGSSNSASAGSNGDYDLTSGPSSSSNATSGDVGYGLSSDTPSDSNGSVDYGTSSEQASAPSREVDYGTTNDRAGPDTSDNDYTSHDRPVDKVKDIEPVKEASPEPVKPAAEPTGPESSDFEEVIDLEECLELHKQWINSGGKSGKQAKRPHSNFDGQELEDVDFTKAILPQSNFENVNCVNTVFRKADLSGSTFKSALLSSADLRVSLLRKADMRNARMDKANLLGADLAGANLEGATLRGVNMSGANLTRTNLCGVNLSSVQGLIPEQLNRAITDGATRKPSNLQTG